MITAAGDELEICLLVNGYAHTARVETRMLLCDFLRDDLQLTGTHVGCEQGQCGACTVLVDGELGALMPDARGTGRWLQR